jgi:hypothetical protein
MFARLARHIDRNSTQIFDNAWGNFLLSLAAVAIFRVLEVTYHFSFGFTAWMLFASWMFSHILTMVLTVFVVRHFDRKYAA